MELENSICITIVALFSFTNQGVFAQTKAAKEIKEEEKKVAITSGPCVGNFRKVMDDDEKQKTENSLNQIYMTPEVRAEYPGGLKAFYKFFYDQYKSSSEQEVKFKAFVSFVIEVDGSLSDVKLVRNPVYGDGKEILKIIKTSPKWKPAMQSGKAVRSIYTLPIGR